MYCMYINTLNPKTADVVFCPAKSLLWHVNGDTEDPGGFDNGVTPMPMD